MQITRSIIPNLFTLANLFAGFTAIILTADKQFERAALFILAAAVFDAFDGFVARLTKTTSELGIEMDSLCDAVSFGVAPSFMLYMIGLNQYPTAGVLFSSLPALAGVYRLARYNIQADVNADKTYFSGMPIPAGALTIVSYIVYIHPSVATQTAYPEIVLSVLAICVALCMVSKIRYDNLPRPSLSKLRKAPLHYILFGLVVGIVGYTRGAALFPIMLVYMLYGAGRHIFNSVVYLEEDQEPMDFDEEAD